MSEVWSLTLGMVSRLDSLLLAITILHTLQLLHCMPSKEMSGRCGICAGCAIKIGRRLEIFAPSPLRGSNALDELQVKGQREMVLFEICVLLAAGALAQGAGHDGNCICYIVLDGKGWLKSFCVYMCEIRTYM